MIKTVITIEYEGFIYQKELGRLLMLASSYDQFISLEIKDPNGKSTYTCKKERQE